MTMRDPQIEALQERLTRLSEASLLINDGLELDAVLQKVLDSSRSLTGARYGVMTTLDDSGQIEDFLASGLTSDEARQLWEMPGGMEFFEYLRTVQGPMRVSDFAAHAGTLGLPEFSPPTPTSAFLTVPIVHLGDYVGDINLAKRDPGEEFSDEDEETLVIFASQAALAIVNARQRRDERRARADLETLINTAPVGVVVFDASSGAPVSFNQEATRIVGSLLDTDQPPEQLLETLSCRRADGREVSLAEWPLAEALSAGETVRAEEIVLSVPDGPSVTVLLNATPILSESGEVESFIITLQDMTPLEELAQMRSEFLGMVSHELRAPLTSIRGSATTMIDAASDLDPAELRQFVRIIVDQADNMRELIDNLLDVARIESGSLPVTLEPAEIAPIVDRARNIFLSGGDRRDLDIIIEPDLPLVVADRRRVAQVIGNLLSNAARHSPPNSPISVNVARDGVHVAVSVSDEGRGIPARQMSQLFRKFFRAEGAGGDTGLGLAICKGIVEAHGGRIWAESEGPSLGARFTFTIPALPEVSDSLRRPRFPSRRARRGSRTGVPILVVDDDPEMLINLRRTLSAEGYDPIVTADPIEAIRAMTEDRPRLALIDMMLPGSDGLELMRDIFKVADAPVVVLSAYGQDELVARAFESGAEDYIVKPFTTTELLARVRAALLRHEERHRLEPTQPYAHGDMVINYAERLVHVGGRAVRLTAKEYGIVFELSINGGRALTHDQILRRVWTPEKPGNVQSLRAHMRRLRRKLDDDAKNPKYIFSDARVGYRMAKSEGFTEED